MLAGDGCWDLRRRRFRGHCRVGGGMLVTTNDKLVIMTTLPIFQSEAFSLSNQSNQVPGHLDSGKLADILQV